MTKHKAKENKFLRDVIWDSDAIAASGSKGCFVRRKQKPMISTDTLPLNSFDTPTSTIKEE